MTTSTSSQAGGITATSLDERVSGRRWWILVVVGLSQLMIALDNTVMNIALPSAQQTLGFADADRQWVITAYALGFGSLLLLSGRLADRFGRKNLLITGLIGFAVASAVGGAATSFGMLVASRAVQGLFAALLAPAALSLLTTTFSAGRERARAFGIFGAITVVGTTVGLLVGGVLTEYLSWRWTMYINIAFALPAIVGAIVLLPRRIDGQAKSSIDIPGTIAVSLGLVALVYGFSSIQTSGWGSPVTLGSLAAGLVLLVVFVIVQTRSRNPLLPMRVVLDRNRGGGFLAMFLGSGAMLSVFLFTTFYLQGILGYSAVATGIAFTPLPVVLVITSAIFGPRINRRISPKVTIPAGMVLGAIAVTLLTRIGTTDNYLVDLLPSLVLLGIGLGLIFSTASSIATLGVRPDDAGVASATVSVSQQVGGSIGVALLNTVAATATTAFLVGNHASTLLATHAALHGFVTAYAWSAGLFIIGAISSALILRPGVPTGLREQPADMS